MTKMKIFSKNKLNVLFLPGLIFSIFYGAKIIWDLHYFYKIAEKESSNKDNKRIPLKSINDIWIVCISFLAFRSIEIIFRKIPMRVFIKAHLTNQNMTNTDKKTENVLECFAKTIYYSFSTFFALYIFWGNKNIFVYFGGNCSKNCMTLSWPYENDQDFVPIIVYFYLAQCGYILYSNFFSKFQQTTKIDLSNHISTKNQNRFTEMTIHYIMTLLMVLYSYFANMMSIAIIPMICYDMGEAILCFSRFCQYLNKLNLIKLSDWFMGTVYTLL